MWIVYDQQMAIRRIVHVYGKCHTSYRASSWSYFHIFRMSTPFFGKEGRVVVFVPYADSIEKSKQH